MAGSRLDEDDVPEAEEHIAPVDDDAYGEDALDAPLENPDAADEEEAGEPEGATEAAGEDDYGATAGGLEDEPDVTAADAPSASYQADYEEEPATAPEPEQRQDEEEQPAPSGENKAAEEEPHTSSFRQASEPEQQPEAEASSYSEPVAEGSGGQAGHEGATAQPPVSKQGSAARSSSSISAAAEAEVVPVAQAPAKGPSAPASRQGSSASRAPAKPAEAAVAAPAAKPAAAAAKPVAKPLPAPAPKAAVAKATPAAAPKAAPKAAPAAAPKAAPVAAAKPAPKPAAPKPATEASTAASAPSAAASSPTAANGGAHKLTFTGPPNAGRARPAARADFSHNTFQVAKIQADNMKLCTKLLEISKAPANTTFVSTLSVGSAAPGTKLQPANISAAAVNRHKKEDRIAQENLALYKRLQTVKPSKDVNRDALTKEFKTAQQYGANVRKFKTGPGAPTAGAGAGDGPAAAADSSPVASPAGVAAAE